MNGEFAATRFDVTEDGDTVTFTINPAVGDLSVIPQERQFILHFKDVVDASSVQLYINGKAVETENYGEDNIELYLYQIKPTDEVKIVLKGIDVLKNNHKEEIINLITKYQLGVEYKKNTFMKCVEDNNYIPNVKPCFKEPLEEIKKMK